MSNNIEDLESYYIIITIIHTPTKWIIKSLNSLYGCCENSPFLEKNYFIIIFVNSLPFDN